MCNNRNYGDGEVVTQLTSFRKCSKSEEEETIVFCFTYRAVSILSQHKAQREPGRAESSEQMQFALLTDGHCNVLCGNSA